MTAQYRQYREDDDYECDEGSGSVEIYDRDTRTYGAQKKYFLVGICGALVTVALLGFVCGYLASRPSSTAKLSAHGAGGGTPFSMPDLTSRFRKLPRSISSTISKEKIHLFIRSLSQQPAVAGYPTGEEQAATVGKLFEKFGLDRVQKESFRTSVPLPDPAHPTTVALVSSSEGHPVLVSVSKSYPGPTWIPAPHMAFSASGSVRGPVIYLNKGSFECFKDLESRIHFEGFRGAIGLARITSHIEPGLIVGLAEEYGMAGLLFYPDPEDFGYDLPEETEVSDSAVWPVLGDPSSPTHSTIVTGRWTSINMTSRVPVIPVHTINARFARGIVQRLGRFSRNPNWTSGFENFTHVGPGFIDPNMSLTLNVTMKEESINVTNVFGWIKGAVEPDRYVLIGAPRESFGGWGVSETVSATAVMLEIARAFGLSLRTSHWRPRRSILFCSWGGSSQNRIGSTEWVQWMAETLKARAVAYVHVEAPVSGRDNLNVSASPLLYQAIFNATRRVANPNLKEAGVHNLRTLYESWLASDPVLVNKSLYFPPKWFHGDSRERRQFNELISFHPGVLTPTESMDYLPFVRLLGVPVVEISFKDKKMGFYPLRRTELDTYENYINRSVDPGFVYHGAVAETLGEIVADLANQPLLPISLLDYAEMIGRQMTGLQSVLAKNGHLHGVLEANNINADVLQSAVHNFTVAASEFQISTLDLDQNDEMALRRVNDQLMQVERLFVSLHGLPWQEHEKHLLLSQSIGPMFGYAGSVEIFPGLEFLEQLGSYRPKIPPDFEPVRNYFYDLVFAIQSAAESIKPICCDLKPSSMA